MTTTPTRYATEDGVLGDPQVDVVVRPGQVASFDGRGNPELRIG